MEIIHPHERRALAQRLANDVDAAAVAKPRGNSWRLGPSALEDECDRKVWYGYRWTHADQRSAQMRRLLDHGKASEERIVGWLRDAGVILQEVDPNASPHALNKQFRIRAGGGHIGGYLDGVAHLPQAYAYPYPMVAEFKSHNDKSFKLLEKDDVEKAKPAHKAQMGFYGWKYDYRYSLYAALNKNDDHLHIEIVENDYSEARDNERRLIEIINSPRPPARITETITDFRCKMCRHAAVCHQGAEYDVNCRSCDYASPVDGGEWRCNLVSQIIPRDFVKVGCAAWHPVGR